MKKNLLFCIGLLFSAITLNAQITYTTITTPVTCYGGTNGSATITSISGGTYFNTSTKGLLISEIYADPTGTDSAYEFVELVATKFIDFSATPYTVIFSNNGTATLNGWIAGTNKTYAFLINSGTVNAGNVVYVGGSAMIPQTNQIRVINIPFSAGDGGIGNATASGVIGNGGPNSDGVAVFDIPVASITLSTVPIDAVFFGSAHGTAVVGGGTQGYQLPINDHYNGGKLQTSSFLAPNIGALFLIKASFGIYDVSTNTFTTPRTWVATPNASFTNLSSSLLIDNLYNVVWSNLVTSVYNPNLSAGTYTFTIIDQLPDTATGSVNIADGPLVDLNATASDFFACVGDIINLSAQNANTYLWSNGASTALTQVTVSGDTLLIVMGTNTVSGCTSPDSVFIDVNAYPVVVFSLADTICNNGGNISLSATPIAGTFTGPGISGSTLDPSALSGMNAATYTYTDTNGCSDNQVENYLVSAIVINATASDLFACEGDLIDLSALNADIYFWNTGDSISNPQIIVTGDILLIVMGTDTTLGCSASDSVFIDVNPYPVVIFSMANDTVCNNGGSITLNATPIGGIFTGSGVTGNILNPSALSGLNLITYTYTDGNGCSDDDIVNYLVINCLGIEELPQKSLNIYPNPASEFVWISTDQIDLRYSIMDLSGKLVANGNLNNEKKLDVQGLTTGIYILTLQNNTFSKQIKLIKK